MASIHIDSELMTNFVPAVPVKAGSHFVTLLDPDSRRPMVIGISTDPTPKLDLVKEDTDGQKTTTDLGALLGIPSTAPVQAFDCQQSLDLTVYLSIAIGTDDGRSNIMVVRPFQLTSGPTQNVSPSLVLPIHSVGKAYRVYMGSADGQHGYPMVLVTHQPDGRITAGSDITRLLISPTTSSWMALRDMELPVNASQILDLAPAVNAYGRGLYALCVVDGKRQIIGEFARYDTDQNDGSLFWFNTSIQTPQGTVPVAPQETDEVLTYGPGSTSIATLTDLNGRSNLLISYGAGLQYLNAREATSKYTSGSLLVDVQKSGSTLFQNSSSLRVSQDGKRISVWSISGASALGYWTFDLPSLKPGIVPQPITLVPSGVSSYSASVSSPSSGPVVQTMVTNDQDGNLEAWSQSLDTCLWRSQPFYSAATATNVAFPSYTVTMQALDVNAKPVTNGKLMIAASSQVNAIVNGAWVSLTTTPTPFDLDFSGDLAIIVGTKSISTQRLEISSLRDSKGIDLKLQTVSIDPSLKVIDKLSAVSTPDALGKARDKAGNLLFEGVSPSNLSLAANAIQGMTGVANNLRKGTATVPSTSAKNRPSDLWHYVKHVAKEATDWIVKAIDGAYHFVCTIAGQVYQFVLDTMEKIGEGLTWVLTKLELAWEKIKDFLGFLFAINDIIQTKRTMEKLLNHFLTYGASRADHLGTMVVDAFFDKLKARLISAGSAGNLNSKSTPSASSSNGPPASHSTSMKWVTERLKNGGAVDHAQIDQSSDGSRTKDDGSDPPEWMTGFQDSLRSFTNKIKDVLESVGHTISSAFIDQNLYRAGDTLKNLTMSMMTDICDGLRAVCHALVKGISDITSALLDIGNHRIQIPVFSALYREWAGDDLTLFDAFFFIMAIPATILIKLVTGSSPPTLPDLGPETLYAVYDRNAKKMAATMSAPSSTSNSGPTVNTMAVINAAPQAKMEEPENAQNGSVMAASLQANGAPETNTKSSVSILDPIAAADAEISAWDEKKAAEFINDIPTLGAGFVAVASMVWPIIRFGLAAKNANAKTPEPHIDFYGPGMWGPVFAIAIALIKGSITFAYPHEEEPGYLERLGDCGSNYLFFLLGAGIISARMYKVKSEWYNDANMAFQITETAFKWVSFVLSCTAYSEELDALTVYPKNDEECTVLGITSSTLGFVGDLCDCVGYFLLNEKMLEAGELVYFGSMGAGALSGGFAIARFETQYSRKYKANLTIF